MRTPVQSLPRVSSVWPRIEQHWSSRAVMLRSLREKWGPTSRKEPRDPRLLTPKRCLSTELCWYVSGKMGLTWHTLIQTGLGILSPWGCGIYTPPMPSAGRRCSYQAAMWMPTSARCVLSGPPTTRLSITTSVSKTTWA